MRRLATLLTLTLLGCGGGGSPYATQGLGGLTPESVDLTVDEQALRNSLLVADRTFREDECAVLEGLISGPGTRRLLMFETRVLNFGEFDLVIGDPSEPEAPLSPTAFAYHDCHGHFHMEGYAAYELLQDGEPVALGTKQGFCLLDTLRVHPDARRSSSYTCTWQGLSSGYGDIYDRSLDGQWVDVTGVPAGSYVLRVTINSQHELYEAINLHPNTVEVPVTLPDPESGVGTLDDDHGDTPATATQLAFPIGLMCAIEAQGDVDTFRTDVVAGTAYRFAVELHGLPDSRLRVLTISGTLLASNDDVGPGDPSSALTWLAPLSGPVILEVRGGAGTSGAYRMSTGYAP